MSFQYQKRFDYLREIFENKLESLDASLLYFRVAIHLREHKNKNKKLFSSWTFNLLTILSWSEIH